MKNPCCIVLQSGRNKKWKMYTQAWFWNIIWVSQVPPRLYYLNGKWPVLSSEVFIVFQTKPFVEKFGLTMAQSGVAISITSITDIVAFGVGSSSILPGVQH